MMKNFAIHLMTVGSLVLSVQTKGFGENEPQLKSSGKGPVLPALDPFTGRIVKNKVRLRTLPSLDGAIVKELGRGDMIIVTGESDLFFSVKPPEGTKAYVFRTFVLDNVVEGSHVNVRLEPDLEAPVIAQLNAGDRVEGVVCANNNKWLEITIPKSTQFYVAREYVEKIGDVNMLATIETRRKEVNQLLDDNTLAGRKELEKPFDEINLAPILVNLNKIVTQYTDFSDHVARAKELQKSIQDSYLDMKIHYLEAKSKQAADRWTSKNQELAEEMRQQQNKIREMEQKIQEQIVAAAPVVAAEPAPEISEEEKMESVTPKMAMWNAVEDALYISWQEEHPDGSMKQFYADQEENAIVLKGVIEPYNRPIKNKPGNYLLVNQENRLPIAFLYSTKINLQDRSGQEHVVVALPRSNNNFAFPAYFVLSVE